jgi:ribosomal protein L37AE/L43A
MTKTVSCPNCGSNRMKMHNPQLSIWQCAKCGYQGPVVVENGNLNKQIKENKKMEKLRKKLLWRR